MFRSGTAVRTSSPTSRRTATLVVVAALVVLTSIGTGAAAVGGKPGPAPSDAAVRAQSTPHRCFPAASWGPAPQGERPCVAIVRVYEDGSVRLRVYDADGTTRYVTGVSNLDD